MQLALRVHPRERLLPDVGFQNKTVTEGRLSYTLEPASHLEILIKMDCIDSIFVPQREPKNPVEWWVLALADSPEEKPNLIDGPHLKASTARQALSFYEAFTLSRPRRFALARIELMNVVPPSWVANRLGHFALVPRCLERLTNPF